MNEDKKDMETKTTKPDIEKDSPDVKESSKQILEDLHDSFDNLHMSKRNLRRLKLRMLYTSKFLAEKDEVSHEELLKILDMNWIDDTTPEFRYWRGIKSWNIDTISKAVIKYFSLFITVFCLLQYWFSGEGIATSGAILGIVCSIIVFHYRNLFQEASKSHETLVKLYSSQDADFLKFRSYRDKMRNDALLYRDDIENKDITPEVVLQLFAIEHQLLDKNFDTYFASIGVQDITKSFIESYYKNSLGNRDKFLAWCNKYKELIYYMVKPAGTARFEEYYDYTPQDHEMFWGIMEAQDEDYSIITPIPNGGGEGIEGYDEKWLGDKPFLTSKIKNDLTYSTFRHVTAAELISDAVKFLTVSDFSKEESKPLFFNENYKLQITPVATKGDLYYVTAPEDLKL